MIDNDKALEVALAKVDTAIAEFADIRDRAAKAAASLKAARRILAGVRNEHGHRKVAPDYSAYIEEAAEECEIAISSVGVKSENGEEWLIAIGNPRVGEHLADVLAQNLGRKGYDVDVWYDGHFVRIADAKYED